MSCIIITTTTTFCPVFQGINLSQQVGTAIHATEIFRPQEEKHKKNYIKMTNEGKRFKSILSLQQRLKRSHCLSLCYKEKLNPVLYSKIRDLLKDQSSVLSSQVNSDSRQVSPNPKATKIPLLEQGKKSMSGQSFSR